MTYFEDIVTGERVLIGRHRFTADDIKAFAARFDPQPFHLDEAAAARSHFGALVASGWHTAAVWMRLTVAHRQRLADAARARGEDVAMIGPALGVREMKWLKPVYAGDEIAYENEVVETRASRSRPRLGLVTIRSTGTNQHGETVLSFLSTTFVERRATGE